ncbi:DUF1348 family protein [Agrobacterium sp. AGB01]|uniref:DUF1348 family protein n=1 Tax=Agrobacterium sp. AGB01 TaxID=2769302 RepID=UPI0035304E63
MRLTWLAHRCPLFTEESSIYKVRLTEDVWKSRDPAKVAIACNLDTRRRYRHSL